MFPEIGFDFYLVYQNPRGTFKIIEYYTLIKRTRQGRYIEIKSE